MTKRDWDARYTKNMFRIIIESFVANAPESLLRAVESQLLQMQEMADGPEFEAIDAVLAAIQAKLPLFE